MSGSEVLRVTGIGSTRLHALADADRQCAQYWDGAHTRARLVEARPIGREASGDVTAWEIDVEFRLKGEEIMP